MARLPVTHMRRLCIKEYIIVIIVIIIISSSSIVRIIVTTAAMAATAIVVLAHARGIRRLCALSPNGLRS